MNKKYMDFVPAKKNAGAVPVRRVVDRPAVKQVKKAPEVAHDEVVIGEKVTASANTFSIKKEPEYGVIEDFRPKFVKTEVEKRPLSRGHFVGQKTELEKAKSKDVSLKSVEDAKKNAKKDVEAKRLEKKDKKTLKIPKSPFINQNKVTKRPLSKNVYEKKIEPTKEKTTGPVTIIAKPEKEDKAGIVVAIILTIILGAVAGTIAFLLLPK